MKIHGSWLFRNKDRDMIQTIYKINEGSIIEVSCTIVKRQGSNRGTRFQIIEILKSSGIGILRHPNRSKTSSINFFPFDSLDLRINIYKILFF
jgi:hypothetical protein